MKKIINSDNKVLYGSIDEPIEWNYQDFQLLNFFNKEIKGLRKKWAYHQFNYIAIMNKDFIIGMAVVDLNYSFSLFSFYCDLKKGMQFKHFTKGVNLGNLKFERNPDAYVTEFKSRKVELLIMKSNDKGELEIHCNFEKKLIVNAVFDYGWNNQPLRVLNPSDPNRFTFTEKCSPLRPKEMDLCLNGEPLELKLDEITAIFDWSGGYLRRETNWLWACMSGFTTEGVPVGSNLAALVNESYFPEDAVWIDGQRKRLHNILFDFDKTNFYKPWHIYDEEGNVDLMFTPKDEFVQKMNVPPIVKIFFKQFSGFFTGDFIDKNGEKHRVDHLPGMTEYHRSIW